jgi:hypothetical protein
MAHFLFLNRELKKTKDQLKVVKAKLRNERIKNKKYFTQTGASVLKKVFRQDQLHLLNPNVKRLQKFSDETIAESLQIKFACGNGYNFLRDKRGYPYPSTRTLLRRIENVKFDCGILYEMVCKIIAF